MGNDYINNKHVSALVCITTSRLIDLAYIKDLLMEYVLS